MSSEATHGYGSAHDLPSVVETQQLIAGMKLLTRFVMRSQRKDLISIEAELRAQCDLVDRFYELIGERHWIFTDQLPTDKIQVLLDSGQPAEQFEAGVIDVIADRICGSYWQIGLVGHEAMRARMSLIERARQHYLDEQWDSSALMLITVMDGFVNDAEPAERRGLHARDAGEMVAWDSVSGHHQGLTSVMPIFRQTFKKRHDEEVFEVHRHGIVHGTLTNYNNRVVATKAWNMLSAVSDWASARVKEQTPAEQASTWKEALETLKTHGEKRRYRDGFESSTIDRDDSGFEANPVVSAASAFLDAWRNQRWGLVAEALPSSLLKLERTTGGRALRAKQIYESHELVDFRLDGATFPDAHVAIVEGWATIADSSGPIRIRWMSQDSDGGLAEPDEPGSRWALAIYPPETFMNADEPRDADSLS